MKHDIRLIAWAIIVVVTLIVIITCTVVSVIFQFSHPDMTTTRRLLEFPQPLIISIISAVIFFIGYAKLRK